MITLGLGVPVLASGDEHASVRASVLVEWSGGLEDDSSGSTHYRRDTRDRLTEAATGLEAHAPGQAGFAVLPSHAPAEAAGWLSVADWYRQHLSGGLSMKTLSRDNSRSNFVASVSETVSEFTAFDVFACRDVIRLYARQGTERINPAAAATAELDRERPQGERSWEIGDSQAIAKEQQSVGHFALLGPLSSPPTEEYKVELTLTEFIDRGDHREELYERKVTCSGSAPPFLDEVATVPPDIRQTRRRVYALFRPPAAEDLFALPPSHSSSP